MIVVPILKNVDETIVGIIIKIEKGFKIPPVKYKRVLSWNKSYKRNNRNTSCQEGQTNNSKVFALIVSNVFFVYN